MISNNLTSETNLVNAHQLRVFSEGLPQYELDKKPRKSEALVWKMTAMPDNWQDI